MDERQYYPAMVEQKGYLLFFKLIPKYAHNICTRIDFDTEIDDSMMRKALRIAFAGLPYCCSRLHKKKREYFVYFSEEQPKIAPTVDLSSYSAEETEKYFAKVCKKGLPGAPLDVQLYALHPAKLAGGKYALLFISSHLITDGYSVMYCLIQAFKTYDALKNHTELPAPGIDPVPFMKKDTEMFFAHRDRDLAWWSKEFETEPVFTSVNGIGSREFIPGKKYGKSLSVFQMRGKENTLLKPIPGDLANCVKNAALERNMSPQIYYMLALRSYLSHCCHTDDVMIQTTVTRRGTIEAKKCGFFLANCQPFRSIVAAEEPLEHALKKLNQIQLNGYRHTTTDQLMFTDIFKKQHHLPGGRTYDSVWFTYQPLYDYTQTELKLSGRSIPTGFSATPLYIYVMPSDTTGEMKVEYTYNTSYVRTESVERLHIFMLHFLEQTVSHPDRTIGELIQAAAAQLSNNDEQADDRKLHL